jgi:hypothetical protein
MLPTKLTSPVASQPRARFGHGVVSEHYLIVRTGRQSRRAGVTGHQPIASQSVKCGVSAPPTTGKCSVPATRLCITTDPALSLILLTRKVGEWP